jgi:hypothetical protein
MKPPNHSRKKVPGRERILRKSLRTRPRSRFKTRDSCSQVLRMTVRTLETGDSETICANTDVVLRSDRCIGRCNVGSLAERVPHPEYSALRTRPADCCPRRVALSRCIHSFASSFTRGNADRGLDGNERCLTRTCPSETSPAKRQLFRPFSLSISTWY